jgi:uncharacterized protein HemX
VAVEEGKILHEPLLAKSQLGSSLAGHKLLFELDIHGALALVPHIDGIT